MKSKRKRFARPIEKLHFKKNTFRRKGKKAFQAWMFLLPSLIGIGVFLFVPFGETIRRSFTNPLGTKFLGMKNYQSIFSNDAFRLAVANTVRFILVCIPLLLVTSLIFALLIRKILPKGEKLQTACLLPMAIPVASISLLWKALFTQNGMDGDGEVRLTIMASIAQDESRKTSERVKAGQKMSREKGVLYGSGNIIGYDRVDGTYVINEEQAATVRRIFNLYAEGHGETTVAKMLIEENRKDGGGGLSWTASKVSRVLRKPTYKGYMTYNKSHIDDFLSHNRINHSEEDFVLVKGNFEPIVSEELWETCNQIRSKRAAFVKGKDGRAHKFGVSFPQNKWTKILFCDCGMRFQIEGYDKTANGGKNMRLICARSKMFKKKDAARALNGIPCPAPYASEWKLELMAREVFRTVWKENAEDILGLLRMLDANLNTTGTPNDGNQLENKLSALNKELDDLVSQRASRSITMDDFLSKSTEINNEIINVEGLLQSSIQEQRPKARLDMHSIEAALSDDASFPDGKIEPGFLDRYANRIVKSNNRYIWMLQLMNVQQIMPIQSERQPIAMVTYKSGVPYDIEQEQIGKQDKESAGLDCATICRPQDFFLNMGRTTRKRKLVEWLESCQENQVSVLDEKIPLLSFAVDFVTAYEYQKARGIKIHPGLWKDMRVDIFLVKKEN